MIFIQKLSKNLYSIYFLHCIPFNIEKYFLEVKTLNTLFEEKLFFSLKNSSTLTKNMKIMEININGNFAIP